MLECSIISSEHWYYLLILPSHILNKLKERHVLNGLLILKTEQMQNIHISRVFIPIITKLAVQLMYEANGRSRSVKNILLYYWRSS